MVNGVNNPSSNGPIVRITLDLSAYADVIQSAMDYHNAYFAKLDPAFMPVTAEEYVQELVNRQLEGLKAANQRIQSDDEVRRAEAQAAKLRSMRSFIPK